MDIFKMQLEGPGEVSLSAFRTPHLLSPLWSYTALKGTLCFAWGQPPSLLHTRVLTQRCPFVYCFHHQQSIAV